MRLERFFNFRTRVLLMFCGVLLISQGTFFVIFDQRSIATAHRVVLDNLYTTFSVSERVLEERFNRLKETVGVLSSDFGFRSAITMMEEETIYSMMKNHSRRIDADIMIAFDVEGNSFSSFPKKDSEKITEAFSAILKNGVDNIVVEKGLSSMIVLDDAPYQIVIVPVYAPELTAFVAVGISIDSDFITNVGGVTNADVSFIVSYDPSHKNTNQPESHLLASTFFEDGLRTNFIEKFSRKSLRKGISFMNLEGDDYLTFIVPLFDLKTETYYAVIQRSWEEALRPYIKHRYVMVTIALAFLFISIFIGVFLSRQVTRPVKSLADAVKQVEKGNYNYMLEVGDRQDELGSLLRGFNNMVKGLSERDQMAYLALHDSLTGLPNRRQFNERIDQIVHKQDNDSKLSAVLLIDLDGFKIINDKYGHAAGDAILRTIGQRLSISAIRTDDIAARLGGDEFAILYDGVQNEEIVKRKVEKLLYEINLPIRFDGQELKVGASIGIAMTKTGLSVLSLLEVADKGCYVSKDAGKNAYSFETQKAVLFKNIIYQEAEKKDLNT